MPVHLHISLVPKPGMLDRAYDAARTFATALYEQGYLDYRSLVIALAGDGSLLMSLLFYSNDGATHWDQNVTVSGFWTDLRHLLMHDPKSSRLSGAIAFPAEPPEFNTPECNPREDGCEELWLLVSPRNGEPPVRCLTHGGLVSSHLLGPRGEASPLYDLQCWQSDFINVFLLWLESGEYEAWAAAELSGVDSSLNRRGFELAAKLAAHLDVEVEYDPMTRNDTLEDEEDADDQ